MYPRLALLRELLRDDGVILISIDDNELHNLLEMMSEIFGTENRFGTIIVEVNPRGRRLGTDLAIEHEYLVAWAKNLAKFEPGRQTMTAEQLAEYSETDSDGRKFRPLGLRKRGALSRREDRPNLHFPIFVNPKDGSVTTDAEKGLVKVVPKLSDGTDGVWRWQKSKVARDGSELFGRQVKRKETGALVWDVFQRDYVDDEEGEQKGANLQ
jgi:adenine-specific DNA-methyltransferase